MSRRVARQLERMMIDVVAYGTGTSASLAPVKVAGKTGTAELTATVKKEGETPPVEQGVDAKPPGFDTDAWFAAYAPVRRPKLAVSVLIVHGGAGGAPAAPAAPGGLPGGPRQESGKTPARGGLPPPASAGPWMCSSSGRFSVAASGNWKSSSAPDVGPCWARLPRAGSQFSGGTVPAR